MDYHYDVMNYRTPKEQFAEGGAVAEEVYEGRPCLECNDNCAGFVPHSWSGLDSPLIPWPGLKFACVRILELYGKVFGQEELCELIIRKTCGSCKCTKDSHDVLHEEWVNVRDRLGFKPVQDPDKRVSKERSYSQGYSWVPPGLPSHKVEKYFNSLPSNKVPKLGTAGEKYRDKQVVVQLPKQDLALTYCKHVEQRHHQSYEDFINARNEIALDIGYARECTYHVVCNGITETSSMKCYICGAKISEMNNLNLLHKKIEDTSRFSFGLSTLHAYIRFFECLLHISYRLNFKKWKECPKCKKNVEPGEIGVFASKFGDTVLWHPTCFTCTECQELLVDLTYCLYEDHLYCERHYAQQFKPRCSACDELIFSGEYTKAMNKDWHSGHFCCWQCDESLTGQRYVLRDEHPYCIKCYESVFANPCDECDKTIGIDSKDLSYKDKHWHEACFLCSKCRVSLVDKQFGSKVEKIYCGNCYDTQFAARCDGCGDIFRAGTKKMEYKTRQWHEKCFSCVVCKSAIGTKSFIPREQEVYCATCYEEKFSTRCVKCDKIITSGGVTYKNEPWHRECFTCSHCSTSLAGQRFTSRDEKPYCGDCFGELFAKRCTSCVKPITGIGGTRFISFEDRHWHNDCFICAACKTSLVGRGFITDAEDIICPECAKQKLM